MALSPETATWLEALQKEGNLSQEVITSLKTAAESSPSADKYMKESVLRQQDYSRQSASIQEAKSQAELAMVEANRKAQEALAFHSQLTTWKSQSEPAYMKALKDAETAEIKAATAVAKLKGLAAQSGIPEDQLGLENLVPIVKDTTQPTFDTSQFVSKSDIHRTINESALLDASVYDLAVEYQELTGKPLKDTKTLVAEAIASGKSLTDYAANKYGFEKLRHDRTEASIKARIDEAVAAQVTQKISELALNPGQTFSEANHNSPVFNSSLRSPADIDADRSGGGVAAAIAAHRTGKYRK